MRTARTAALLSLLPTLLFGTLVGTSAAQENPPANPSDVVDDTADRRRLLTLEDGSILRIRSRVLDGRWQVRSGPQWVDLRGDVTRARLLKEVVAEARRLAEALGGAEDGRRVGLARWMIAQGLYPEAIEQLDHVLRADPSSTAVHELVRTTAIPLELPAEAATNKAAELKALLKAGAAGSPATREVAAQRLAQLARVVDLREVVVAELKVPQNRRREFAAVLARRLFAGELLRELSDRAILDTFDSVRDQVALALREADDVAVLAPAIRALNSQHTNVRANAAKAMASIGHAAAVEPLVHHLAALQGRGSGQGYRAHIYIGTQTSYVMDYDVEIAQASSIADPIVNVQDSGVILDARVVVQMSPVVEMRAVMRSLKKLTAADVAETPQAWSAWWDEHRADWRSLERASAERRGPMSGS